MKIEPEDYDESVVALDTYNSDLNLVIDASGYSSHPLTSEGFAFMWAGARCTHGVSKGKVCFEVKILKNEDVSHLPADEPNPHVVRVGFSVESSTLQLGEDPLSYGYGGTGKISTNCQFKDYGSSFGCGDVILAVMNMDSDQVQIGYAKNGKFLGWAYRVNKGELKGQALFPHVLTKNIAFEVNFGQKEKPYSSLPDNFKDYTFISCVPLDQRVSGTRAPKRKEDCEMIMMCGLPGAGKSVWAADYSKKHPEKKYNVLGTNNIIDKMKVMGLPRKRNYAGRWEVLIQMSTKCLNKMFQIGSKLRRNYILDQTNVYPTAQRRKMRNFEGFKRIAVVVVPSEAEYKKRCDKRDREEGKEVPDSAVLEMKANFKIPEEGDLFDEIKFTELQRKEAEDLVGAYNEEGRAAIGPPRKQFKPNDPGFDNKHGSDSGRGNMPSRGTPSGRGYSSRGGFDGGRSDFDSGSRGGFRGGRGGFGGSHGDFGGNRGGDFGGRRDYSGGRGGDFGGDRGGDFGRSRGGDFGGSRGGDFGGSRGGDFGGSRGGDFGGSRGGDFGGSRGGDFGGSRGGDFSGSRGGDFGGSRGGDFGGSRGGDFGGSRGGDFGGSRGGFDGNRGDFNRNRGGHDGTRGGFDGGRGGYSGNRGGFDKGQRGGRGGFEGNQRGYDSGRGGFGDDRGSFESGHGGFGDDRGGFNAGRGGFTASRGGFEGRRGSFDGGRGAHEGGRGGFGQKRKSDDSTDSRGNFSAYEGYGENSSGYGSSSRGSYGSRGGGARGRGDFGSSRGNNRDNYGNRDFGNDNSDVSFNKDSAPGRFDRGGSSGARGQRGFRGGPSRGDMSRGGSSRGGNIDSRGGDSNVRGGFGKGPNAGPGGNYGGNTQTRDSSSGYGNYQNNYNERSQGGYRGTSDSYPSRDSSSYGTGAPGGFKKEPGTEAGGFNRATIQGGSTHPSGRPSRWSAAETPQSSTYSNRSSTAPQNANTFSTYPTQVKTEPASNTGAPRYDSYSGNSSSYTSYIPPSASNQGFQGTQAYGYQANAPTSTAPQPWTTATQSTAATTQVGQDPNQWSQYYQQQSQPSQYYNQYYGQPAAAPVAYASMYPAK